MTAVGTGMLPRTEYSGNSKAETCVISCSEVQDDQSAHDDMNVRCAQNLRENGPAAGSFLPHLTSCLRP